MGYSVRVTLHSLQSVIPDVWAPAASVVLTVTVEVLLPPFKQLILLLFMKY